MADSTDSKEELSKLRRTVRQYLRVISGVPMRAVDCDQDKEERLRITLSKLSGYKY